MGGIAVGAGTSGGVSASCCGRSSPGNDGIVSGGPTHETLSRLRVPSPRPSVDRERAARDLRARRDADCRDRVDGRALPGEFLGLHGINDIEWEEFSIVGAAALGNWKITIAPMAWAGSDADLMMPLSVGRESTHNTRATSKPYPRSTCGRTEFIP